MLKTNSIVTMVLAVMILAIFLPVYQTLAARETFAEINNSSDEISYSSAISDGVSCGMHTDEDSAKNDVQTVVTSRSKYRQDYSIKRGMTYYYEAANMSQPSLNSSYNQSHPTDIIKGTCSLVAMTMMANAVKDSNTYHLNKDKDQIFEGFRNAYAIASAESTYDRGYDRYFESTIEIFYTMNGISVDANLINANSGVNESLCESLYPLSIINFEGADTTYRPSFTTGHSVLFVGCYYYETTYKERYFLVGKKTVTKPFHVFVVCDGWTDSNSGTFGSNYQFVVFNDTATVSVVQIPDMIPNIFAE